MRGGPRCKAIAPHPNDPTPDQEWALICHLRAKHLGHHVDMERGVTWEHRVPPPG